MNPLQSITKRIVIIVSFLFLMTGLVSAEEPPEQKPLSMKGPRILFVGKKTDYTLTVFNSGKTVSKNTRVDLLLPKNLQCTGASMKASVSKPNESGMRKISWQPGDINPGEQKEIIFRIDPKAYGKVELSASYTDSATTTPVKISNRAMIMTVPHIRISTYDTEDPVVVGKNTTYVVEVINDGSAICTTVKVEYEVPKEMKFVSATTNQGLKHKTEGNLVKFDPLPIFQPGGKIAYRITCTATEQGSAQGKATLTYDQFEKPIYDIEGTSVYRE